MPFPKDMIGQVGGIFGRLSPKQRLTVGLAFFGVLAAVVGMVLWAGRPEFSLLYGDLDPESAGEVIEALKEAGVPYKLARGGSAVLVPKDKVYELRVELAGKGVLKGGVVGYELFDRRNFGTSEFVQKVNYKRALEGELARTIQGMAEISYARVHLALPEERLFKEDQEEPSASIMVAVKPGARLSPRQVMGIQNLVAGSVEGLKPERVTILDIYGNVLSEQLDRTSPTGMAASQMELRQQVEAYLVKKVQTMLDRVLGKNNAVVRVSAELDFQHIERNREYYDPEGTVVISQETEESETPLEGNASVSGRTEHTIVNYEVSKTVERIVRSAGSIKRLSAAVLVNSKKELSQAEVARLTALVGRALGVDPGRGDQIEVYSMPFETSEIEAARAEMKRAAKWALWMGIARKVGMGLIVVLVLLWLRSKLRKVTQLPMLIEERRAQLPETEAQKAQEIEGEKVEIPALEEKVSPEALKEAKLQEFIADFVQKEPDKAVRLLRAWLVR
ncbi:MAG: flagellar M-ring protein FliF [Candidatus Latescibacterota bacterium]|nr:MAG: flagellar M-ring protein FliF [Candidatus Latescibacterota bacterium]